MRYKNRGNFGTIVLSLMIILIFSLTTYFCLDIFQIIEVPEKYSISRWINLTSEELIAIDAIEKIIPNADDIEESIIVILDSNNLDTYQTSAPTLYDVDNGQKPSAVYSDDKFYYNQLDQYGKIIYDKLHDNKEGLKTGRYTAEFGTTFDNLLHEDNGSDILNNAFQLSVNALTFDNPDIFYIDVTKMYLLTEITTTIFKKTYKVSVGCNNNVSYLSNEFPTEASVKEAESKIEEIKWRVKHMSDYESVEKRIRTVHDYMVDMVDYDISVSNPNIYNMYGALVKNIAVCEGYAKAFKYIMDDLNIPCIIVCGVAKDKEGRVQNHAWNYVRIDGQWYAIDVTWDDPIIIGNGIVRKEVKYAYYLRGSDKFFEDHTEDGNIVADSNFIYPKISVSDYKY